MLSSYTTSTKKKGVPKPSLSELGEDPFFSLRVSYPRHGSPGWSRTGRVTVDDFERLTLPPLHWDYSCAPPQLPHIVHAMGETRGFM